MRQYFLDYDTDEETNKLLGSEKGISTTTTNTTSNSTNENNDHQTDNGQLNVKVISNLKIN